MQSLSRWAMVALSVVMCCASPLAQAAPGDLDPSFGVNGLSVLTEPGYTGPFYGVAIQPDGKIIAQGSGVVPYSSSAPYLVRFNGDGSLDGGFGSGGIVLVDPWGGFTSALAIQGDGKILTALWSSVVRYSASGVLETTFPSNLQSGLAILNIEIQPDGKILVAGGDGLVRYNSDATYDSSFGNGGKAQGSFGYFDIALQSDGKIIAVGNIAGTDMLVVRYNVDGTFDTSFGSNGGVIISGGGGATSVSVQPDGKIITTSSKYVSNYPAPTTFFIVMTRFNVDGTLDSSFGSGGVAETLVGTNGRGVANALQPDGKILVSGLDQGIFVARYNTDGSLDTQFGSGGVVNTGPGGAGNAVALQSDGRIVVAGWWIDSMGNGGPTVARYLANSTPVNNTPVGSGVNVVLDFGTVTFSSVTTAGNTTMTESSTGPVPPAGFQTGQPPLYYDIQTTATYTPPVDVCIDYDPSGYADPSLAQLFHYEGGAWIDVTTSNDSVNGTICGQVSSLSPFAIMVPAQLEAQVQQPINADGSSVFNASRGVVPVKFNLTAGGQATCTLPTATIAVYRTGGTTNQSITESVYSMSADNGSFYRIAGCQYLYNLNSKALGKGTYLVQILINNAVVGSTTFGLK